MKISIRPFLQVRATGLAWVLAIAGCGGGGGSEHAPPPPPPSPPTISYSSPPPLTVNVAITALTPVVTGNPGGFAITPALPAGLALNAATGAINGIPATVQPSTNYQITATNAGGSASAQVSITVNDLAPVISYPQATYTVTTGVPVSAISPTVTGGAAVVWTIDQPLPLGLTFSSVNGIISGTPVAASSPQIRVITAQNSGGSSSFAVALTVKSGILLDLGHAAEVTTIVHKGQRMVSVDLEGHAVLWNAQSGAILFGETNACDTYCGERIDLAGSTAVVRSAVGFHIRDADDGTAKGSVPFDISPGSWWRLASDGSYLAAGDATRLVVWSPSGVETLSRAGNYANAVVFAAPAELRIGGGPAGSAVIENIALPSGTSTLTPAFQGTMHSWFSDGEKFLTHIGNTIWVYSKAAAPQDIAALPSIEGLGGRGNWYWRSRWDTGLQIYAVGSGGTHTASFPPAGGGIQELYVPSGDTIAIIRDGDIGVIDLAAPVPTRTNYQSRLSYLSTYGASSATDWAFGNRGGQLLGEISAFGSPQRYARGQLVSIAANAKRIALLTSSGDIEHFDSATLAPEGTITLGRAGKLSLSADGAILASGPGYAEGAWNMPLRLHALPAGTLIEERSSPILNAVETLMSDSVTLLGDMSMSQLSVTRNDGTVIHTGAFASDGRLHTLPLRLAPGGEAFAVTVSEQSPDAVTNLYSGSSLVGAASGVTGGWIDDTRLLVNRYVPAKLFWQFAGTDIVGPTGVVLSSPPLPELYNFQTVTPGSIYSPRWNKIYDLSNGAVLWSSAASIEYRYKGAVAGANVIFASDAYVRAEPR